MDFETEYREHLSQILKLFVDDDMISSKSTNKTGESLVDSIILSDENMKDYWIPAVTHVSYNYTEGTNWENLELLGDVYSKSAFTRLFMNLYPRQTQLFYSETSNFYTSNDYISNITDNILGLTKFIRIKGINNPTKSMKADCFESFCGALVLSGDREYIGFGLVLNEYFITYIYKDVNVEDDRTRTYGKSVTQLDQIAKRIGIDSISNKHSVNNYVHTYEYFLTKNQITEFNKYLIGKAIPQSSSLTIGKATGRGKSKIKDEAADEAFSFLNRYGIDTPWAIKIKAKRDITHHKVKSLAFEVIRFVRTKGYKSIMFKEIDKEDVDDFIVVVLLGIDGNGIQHQLEVTTINKEADSKARSVLITDSHVKVLETYLNRIRKENK